MKGEDPALGPDFFGKVFPGKGVYRDVVVRVSDDPAFTRPFATKRGA